MISVFPTAKPGPACGRLSFTIVFFKCTLEDVMDNFCQVRSDTQIHLQTLQDSAGWM